IAAALSPPPSEPAKRKFFLPRATTRNARSAALLSISMRPSSQKRSSASHRVNPRRRSVTPAAIQIRVPAGSPIIRPNTRSRYAAPPRPRSLRREESLSRRFLAFFRPIAAASLFAWVTHQGWPARMCPNSLVDTSRCIYKGHHRYTLTLRPDGSDQTLTPKSAHPDNQTHPAEGAAGAPLTAG